MHRSRTRACFTVSYLLASVAAGFALAGAALAEGQPELVVNPYANVDWETYQQYKGNLHTHTTQSDGKMEPAEVIRNYRERGYTILALTDHNLCTWPWSKYDPDGSHEGMLAITGNELSRHHHAQSLFCPLETESRDLEKSLEEVKTAGGLSILNHPAMHWSRGKKEARNVSEKKTSNALIPDEIVERYAGWMKNHPHLIGMEVLNGTRPLSEYTLDRGLWDALLMRLMPSRPVWGFANDDMHGMKHLGRDWVSVLSPSLEVKPVRKAIGNGTYFFSSIRVHEGKNGSIEATPVIKRIDHDPAAGTITITATESGKPLASDACRWIADGKLVHNGPTLNYRTTPHIGSHVRAELHGQGGITLTNPFGFSRK